MRPFNRMSGSTSASFVTSVLLRWYFDEFREDVHAAILVS